MEAQVRVLGSPCPILECASITGVEYCLRDCPQFPCGQFRDGPYPYSEGFLKMQERRRKEIPQSKGPVGDAVQVPVQYWEDLWERDLEKICESTLAVAHPPHALMLPFLREVLLVDVKERSVKRQKGVTWEKMEYPLLELLILIYLLRAKAEGLSGAMISVQELKDSHFFQGPHELYIGPLLERYGRDRKGFKRAAESLGGEELDLADAAYRFPALPKVPLYYLLWEGDEEFPPRVSVLFDRSVERHLSADAIWGLVTLVTTALLRADESFRPSGHGS